MSAEEDEQLGLELESTQFISDITMEVVNVMTIIDDLQLLHIQTIASSLPQQDDFDKDVNRNSESETAKKGEDKLNPVKKKKLVSALKGSRAKEGNSVKGIELSVTWGPDVYDPIPSAAQTFTKIKKLRPKKKKKIHEDYKKNGKYKQKGKVDKGGSSSSSKNKNKSMKPIQKQVGDDVRMWWQQDPLEEIYDDDSFATGERERSRPDLSWIRSFRELPGSERNQIKSG